LASIKAATSSLLSRDVTFSPDQTQALLETVDSEADRLDVLVENLLDMSRVQSGALEVTYRDVSLEEVVEAALSSLGPRGETVEIDIDEAIPRVHVDPVLLERAVANLVDNALVHGGGRAVRVEAGMVPGQMILRVIDHGPGIPTDQRELVFRPFQRLGDSRPVTTAGAGAQGHSGVGLGLAVARGFVDSMGGDLSAEDTPAGGCTMVLRIPVARGEGTTEDALLRAEEALRIEDAALSRAEDTDRGEAPRRGTDP